MSLFSRMSLIFSLIICLSAAQYATAQFRSPFKKRNPQNQTARELAMKDGPWLIMCTSFTGEDAEQRARLLANELSQYRLKTYVYRQTFDYSNPTTGMGWQQPDLEKGETRPQPKRMIVANNARVNEVAVLVGDFASYDDNKAQKVLAKIKNLNVSNTDSQISSNAFDSNTEQPTRSLQASKGGPLRTAILVPNPMLPDDYFKRNAVDDFVIKMNKNVKHSLLDCPGLYSVKIATFSGEQTIDPSKIQKSALELLSLKKSGKSLAESRLIQAAADANTITMALRKKGIEAYEFHDRQESYVCIGSFDWVTRQSNDSIINNPEIVRLVNSCRPQVQNVPGIPNAIIPKSIKGIPLDPEPTAILAPKRNSNTRTSGRLSFRR